MEISVPVIAAVCFFGGMLIGAVAMFLWIVFNS